MLGLASFLNTIASLYLGVVNFTFSTHFSCDGSSLIDLLFSYMTGNIIFTRV